MPEWRRCDTCRRILPAEDFDEDSPTCRADLTKPARGVRTSKAAAATPGAPAGPVPAVRHGTPIDLRGRGDREARDRRARRTALEALAVEHPEEFAALLAAERLAENL